MTHSAVVHAALSSQAPAQHSATAATAHGLESAARCSMFWGQGESAQLDPAYGHAAPTLGQVPAGHLRWGSSWPLGGLSLAVPTL